MSIGPSHQANILNHHDKDHVDMFRSVFDHHDDESIIVNQIREKEKINVFSFDDHQTTY